MSQVNFTPTAGQVNTADPLGGTQSQTGPASSSTTPPATAGTGGAGAAGSAPDIPSLPMPKIAASSLGNLATLSLEQLVEAIGVKGRKTMLQSGLEAIKAKADEIRELNEKKLAEIQKQLDELKKKEKLSPFQKAFKWLGRVLGAIVSVATIAVGVATGNVLLAAGGIIGLTMLINDIVNEATDGKVSIGAGFTALAKECGFKDETARWIGMGFEMAITLVGVGLSLGAGFSSAASGALSTAAKVATYTSTAANILSGATMIGQGSLTIVAATYDKEIADARAELKDLQALLARIQAAMASDEDFVKEVVERSNELMGKVREIVGEKAAAQMNIASGAAPSMA
ncbi:MAG: type III secretion system translocon subunit SctE [Deltaproteobacteria bacterium]|jgi:hypothetical protein|nr:type III secretion system translocon subunit SctE [Deltaproteobacteria bacterium]